VANNKSDPQFTEALNKYVLGETSHEFHLDSIATVRDAAISMTLQATRVLKIFSHDLEPVLYNNKDMTNAITQLVLGHSRARVQILVQDSVPAVSSSHCLIDLVQRLTSSIWVRKVNDDYLGLTETYLLADGAAFLHRTRNDHFDSVANFNAPAKVARLSAKFDEIWELSSPDPQLRRLMI